MLYLIKKTIKRIIFLIRFKLYKFNNKKIKLYLRPLTPKLVKRISVKKKIKEKIIRKEKIKIILGAANTGFKGWISTDQDVLDITKEKDWKKLLGKHKIDNMLAEHVFEHLTPEQAKAAFSNVNKYLKKGGIFRFAVPDGYHPSSYLRSLIGVNGLEQGADDHKIYFNIDNIKDFIQGLDFKICPVEFFDSEGYFHKKNFNLENGFVKRCLAYNKGRFDDSAEYEKMINSVEKHLRSQFKKMRYPSTSLFIDFLKRK
jgi:predicted SAM-dependent methyltransferase